MVIFHSYVKVYQRFKGRLTAPTALPPGDGLLHGSHGHSLADEVGGWTRDTQRPHQPQVTDQPWVTGPGEKPMGKWRFNHDKWRFNQFNHEKWMIMVNGHAGQEPIYWRYRFHIYFWPIYISILNFREYPHNSYGPKYGTAPTYLHVLDPESFPLVRVNGILAHYTIILYLLYHY